MKNTTKVYKYLKYTLAAELFCMWMLGTIFKVKITSAVLTIISLLLVALPLDGLLYLKSKDDANSETKKILYKAGFWLVNIICVCECIVKIITVMR